MMKIYTVTRDEHDHNDDDGNFSTDSQTDERAGVCQDVQNAPQCREDAPAFEVGYAIGISTDSIRIFEALPSNRACILESGWKPRCQNPLNLPKAILKNRRETKIKSSKRNVKS
jgi:hypothetical protein